MIQSVNSNTSLTLDKPFAETTVSNSNYRILLNTAAHFPSDTAAKVERALEQLSDINEAAINNDRTVTAATKVNGKGLSSTMGDLHLNPASVNTNRGGTINFHYNQASSSTSSVYEDASGRIRVDGNLDINGSIGSPLGRIDSRNIFNRVVNLGTGIRPISSTVAQRYDTTISFNNSYDNKTLSMIYNPMKYIDATNWQNSMYLLVYDLTQENSFEMLGIGYNSNGWWTVAPTPGITSNNGSIATTAFVNNRLPYTVGGWTPEIKGSTTAGAFTYSSRNAMYIKLGRLVYIYMWMAIKCTTVPTGNVLITGLPFTTVSCGQKISANGWGFSGCQLIHAGTYGNLQKINNVGQCVDAVFGGASGTSNDYQNVRCQVNDTAQFFVTGCYMTN